MLTPMQATQLRGSAPLQSPLRAAFDLVLQATRSVSSAVSPRCSSLKLTSRSHSAGDATAGIGAFAVAAAGRVRFVHACDDNPAALCYLARNAELNGTERNMRLWQLEPGEFIREIHGASPRCYVTQFVLDLRGGSFQVLGE